MKEQRLVNTREAQEKINLELWVDWKAGNTEALQSMLWENRGLMLDLLKSLKLSNDEDMEQEATLAMILAINSWKPDDMYFVVHAFRTMLNHLKALKAQPVGDSGITLPEKTLETKQGKRFRFLSKQVEVTHARDKLFNRLGRKPSLTEIAIAVGLPDDLKIVRELLLSTSTNTGCDNDLLLIVSQEHDEQYLSELSKDVRQEMSDRLTDDEQTTVCKFYGIGTADEDQRTAKVVAEETGQTVRQVKYSLHNAKAKLRQSPVLQSHAA